MINQRTYRAVEHFNLALDFEAQGNLFKAYKHMILAASYAPTQNMKQTYIRRMMKTFGCNAAKTISYN